MKVLVIGSGPIIVGQACEFDYSGTQACKVLKEEGHEVILLNSNPASIMTDPENSDKTYIEELNINVLEEIIKKEKPEVILPTLGGQTALNLAMEAHEKGILVKNKVKLIGASYSAIKKAEDRKLFRDLVKKIGLNVPKVVTINNINDIKKSLKNLTYPVIIRSSYTLGGNGCYTINNEKELLRILKKLNISQEVQIEENLNGWKEYELEVVRDKKGNCIVICSIENLDPMGIHTGDSITVAPAQTLRDKEYQEMRRAAFKILEAVGVETGGANVQFAVNPETGKMVVIEMNPRVSRSSALASKVTGYPIARVATQLALGYTLDQLDNVIIGNGVPASFEPTIDYIVTKIPKFNFEKFSKLSGYLGMKMQSVGEVIGIGRNFQESLLKAIQGLEISDLDILGNSNTQKFDKKYLTNYKDRIFYVFQAINNGLSVSEIYKISKIDCWFLEQIEDLVYFIKNILTLNKSKIVEAKRRGLSDYMIAKALNIDKNQIKEFRLQNQITSIYKKIDSCAAEFDTNVNYLYSSYGEKCEVNLGRNKKILVIGSGANRIGQGVEFDYNCVQTIKTIKELGYESIIINNNPETVSTDFNISNRLYIEPITKEHVENIIEKENPIGIFFQFGGQTSINILRELSSNSDKNKFHVLGSNYDVVDLCEDREKFYKHLKKLNISQVKSAIISEGDEIKQRIEGMNFPLILRPSYVISGSSMQVINSENELDTYFNNYISNNLYPIIIEEYLEGYKEIEVDGISDGEKVVIAGIMEQVEPVGIHSGDSSCIFPTCSINKKTKEIIKNISVKIITSITIKGFFNIQFAVKDNNIYIIEVNPRASRTIPYLSKSLGISLTRIATKVCLGVSLSEQKINEIKEPNYYTMKVPVFSKALSQYKPKLGPNMLSTGEKMYIARSKEELLKKQENSTLSPIYLQEFY